MTAIIWNPREGTLVADCRESYTNGRYTDTSIKIGFGTDFIAAWSGDLSYVRKFFSKWCDVLDENVLPEVTIKELLNDKEHIKEITDEAKENDSYLNILLFYRVYPNVLKCVELTNGGIFMHIDVDRPYALGSGGDITLGAVHAGASSQDAIRIASEITESVSKKCVIVNVMEQLQQLYISKVDKRHQG